MPHLFYGELAGEYVLLDERETHHLKVVRHKVGDVVKITDGKGNLYICKLVEIGKNRSTALIEQSNLIERPQENPITLYVACENWDRLRWLVEKSVEIGVDEIVVYKSKRSRSFVEKKEKIELVVREAAKQCERFLFPRLSVYGHIDFEKLKGKVVILHKEGEQASLEDFLAPVTIVVGPEGDFEKQELEKLSQKGKLLSLGKKILRFETAAILSLCLAGFTNGRI
ncbi:16S rRNA (uracil(1498)-N(3))-methyltransferase [Pseudothermotoga thermarum]|uniref:Ribosomal RNA small subunit methyltransferase E n=1 Tax=Pseudothermotoga thermarum DSM 5069 TaxID=688269 RepID=F7YVU0_9THEM|nr:16S rRNA (uracil(1498)-N(3))-methyltransferase [Pseudothermotoga thermarum]AEH51762.1 protein of unknown function DUF558 [Pseudothermotoga thermarum DSM 5069]